MRSVSEYLGGLADILKKVDAEKIGEIGDAILEAWENGKKVILIGNGGSAATASHWALDLSKGVGFPEDKPLRALALADSVTAMTAWANDDAFQRAFERQVLRWAEPGDVVIALSASGSSPNVLQALAAANSLGAVTIGLTGAGGMKLASLSRLTLFVPTEDVEQIEDAHLAIAHAVKVDLRGRLRTAAAR